MTGKERRQLNDNRGFSLVELLIAVVILAIIAIPLMRLFVSSTRINVKSRTTLRATTVAQDIMEGLKAYNIEELKEQFNKPTDGFYVTDSRLVKGEIKEETSLEVDSAGDPDEGIYCFSMAGVKLQGSVYDALIRVDGRGYMDDPATKSHDNPFNNDAVAKIGGVRWNKTGNSSDGLYAEDQEFRKKILEEVGKQLEAELNAAGIDKADITYKTPGLTVSRFFILDIADGGTDADGNQIADVELTVSIESNYGGVTKNFDMMSHIPCANYAGGNLYFFYYPFYEAFDEEIQINNPDHLDLSMSIIKQIDESAGLTDAQLRMAENQYHVLVDFTGCDKDKLILRTNLGTSLVNRSYLLTDPNPKPDPSDPFSLPGQAKFMIDGAERHDLNIYNLDGIRNTVLGAAGADSEITEFIYDVEVMIYKEGAAANGFPDDDRMVTIRGNINN